MAPGLARKHPEIQTYSGVGLTDKSATVRIAMTPLGFSASVRGAHGSWFVDTLYHLDRSTYVSYYAKDLKNTHGNFVEREAAGVARRPRSRSRAPCDAGVGEREPGFGRHAEDLPPRPRQRPVVRRLLGRRRTSRPARSS